MIRFVEFNKAVWDAMAGFMWLKDAALNEFPLWWQEALDIVTELNNPRFGGCRSFVSWKA